MAAERDVVVVGYGPTGMVTADLGPGLLSSRHALGAGQLSVHGIVAFDGRRACSTTS